MCLISYLDYPNYAFVGSQSQHATTFIYLLNKLRFTYSVKRRCKAKRLQTFVSFGDENRDV